ncbi:hypothetical protein AXX17_AT2G15470 [Arabidopsis thaliana]|uniref:Reverse transcriptase zinc-binding domain-containing protein n=1 Tax=Arabidopsis thaliana TaxID=3702 RepID=A0A178VU58_ARATH|nr:hypothetical protein AXX17_AT2G15470 [Arabidopsis thaliana]
MTPSLHKTWVAWFKLHFLHGSLNNFWIMKQQPTYTWLANKLLKIREDAFHWIKLRVDNADYFGWEVQGKIHNRYSTGLVYHLFLEDSPLVPWRAAVWIYRGIPKHSFLTWLLVLNQCPTRDRILGWGLHTDPVCMLCNSSPESRDHLFYQCNLSWIVWSSIALRTPIPTSPLMVCLCLPDASPSRSADTLLRLIDCTIRNRITTYRDYYPRLASSMHQLWFSTS